MSVTSYYTGLLISLFLLGGCISNSPQLFIGTAGQVNPPTGPSGGGEEAQSFPAGQVKGLRPSATVSQSPNFKVYGESAAFVGKKSAGNIYQLVTPGLSLGERALGGE